MSKKESKIITGIIRIKAKDLTTYEKTENSWKKSKQQFPEILKIVKLYKSHKSLNELIDKKDPEFIKGQLGPKKEIQGVRINILPDGKKIDKAYSLFAKNLKVHDQSSDEHWDVLYQNKGGTWAYCYTLDKKLKHRNQKYNKVKQFTKILPNLFSNVSKALDDKNDHLAIPMYTLLKTYMRVGNEIYYKAHKHKGLTTLKKKDIKIEKNLVTFNYLAKDGVPRKIVRKFPKKYVSRLKSMTKKLNNNDFVFTNCNTGHPLRDQQFKKAFKNYCGKEFYPHIVRSHYATSTVQNFLKGKRKISKEEANQLFLSVAAKLGHKKFIKKENQWKDNYSVTINHYIEPKLVEKVRRMVR